MTTRLHPQDFSSEMKNLIDDKDYDEIESDLRDEAIRLMEKYRYNPDGDWWLREVLKNLDKK